MKKILLALSALFIVSACSDKNSLKNTERGRIDLERGFKNLALFRLSEVAEDIEYVFLETNDNCLMNDVFRMVYSSPYFFITDNRRKSIFIFDETGKHVNTLSAVGQGPEEYINIRSFDVHDNTVYILDSEQKKVLIYDINGKCISTFRIEQWASLLKITDEGNVLLVTSNLWLNSNEGYVFSEYDRDFNLKRKFKQMEPTGSEVHWVAHAFYRQRGDLIYWEYNIFDTVYTVLPQGRAEARFILDPGTVQSAHIMKNQDADGNVKSSEFELARLIETDEYVFLFGVYDREFATLLYSKNKNQTAGVERLTNNIDGGMPFWPYFKLTDNKVADARFPYEIKKYLDKEPKEHHKDFNYLTHRIKMDYDAEKHRKLLESLEKTDDMSNPVLIIATIKSGVSHEK